MKRERSVESDLEDDEVDAVALLSGLSPMKLAKPRKIGGKKQYSRKSKSLGLLATRFVDMCKDLPDGNISLDNASKTLSVVRRRIYDVVNVLQSIGIVERQGKNSYLWHGAEGMRRTLEIIRREGPEEDAATAAQNGGGGAKRGESLGALSRKFVALFVCNEGTNDEIVSLESAASGMNRSNVNTPEKASGTTKTKVRRLYDVANIFAAIGIISKHRVHGARKPGFRWNRESALFTGNADFFSDDVKRAYEEDDEEEDEEEEEGVAEAGGPEDDYVDAQTLPGLERRSSARVTGKRKLFDKDEETAASSAELQAMVDASSSSSSTSTSAPSFSYPSTVPSALVAPKLVSANGGGLIIPPQVVTMTMLKNPDEQENNSIKKMTIRSPGFMAQEGRCIRFPVKKEGVQATSISTVASPDSEKKAVANLLMSFTGPLFP